MTPREKNMSDIGLIALRHGVTRNDVLNHHGKRCPKVHAARYDVAMHFRERELSWSQIGRIVGRDHSTVLFWAGRVKTNRTCGKVNISAQLTAFCANENERATDALPTHDGPKHHGYEGAC